MKAIRDDGVDKMLAICGGSLYLRYLSVFADDAWLEQIPLFSSEEDDFLDAADGRRNSSRSSCQMIMSAALKSLTVSIAPE